LPSEAVTGGLLRAAASRSFQLGVISILIDVTGIVIVHVIRLVGIDIFRGILINTVCRGLVQIIGGLCEHASCYQNYEYSEHYRSHQPPPHPTTLFIALERNANSSTDKSSGLLSSPTPDMRSSSSMCFGVSPGICLRLRFRVFRLCPNAALIV
jgi:hypothetical protein